MQNDIILLGGGGHAKACLDVVLSTERYKVLGYIDKSKTLDDKFSVKYLGDDDQIINYLHNCAFLIAIGQMKSPDIRVELFNKALSLGAKFPVIKSPSAYVSKFSYIEEGTIIMHNVVIQADVRVGKNCIINDGALIEHDTLIGSHCHISTSTTLNGNVSIGDGTFIGSGTTIKNGLVIGKNVVVGAGSVVVKNVLDSRTVYGNPARLKSNA